MRLASELMRAGLFLFPVSVCEDPGREAGGSGAEPQHCVRGAADLSGSPWL